MKATEIIKDASKIYAKFKYVYAQSWVSHTGFQVENVVSMVKVKIQAKILDMYYHGGKGERDFGDFTSCAKNTY